MCIIRFALILLCSLGGAVYAASTGATFGEVVKLGYTPSDVVLDESRSRLYLVNNSANRVDVYDYVTKQVVLTFAVGTSPVAGAISMDSRYLYITNNSSSSLTVIDLSLQSVTDTVSLDVKPSGVEVGNDGRVLIATEGTSTTDTVQSLLLYDPAASTKVTAIAFGPPATTPTTLPSTTIGRPVTTFKGKLIRTLDGNYIIGMSVINSSASTVMYVYEVSSASVLRSRTVTGQSTVLSIAPDGAHFMAGYTLYETATLNVVAQQSASNVPFPLTTSTTTTASFSTVQNVGGSSFTPDGATLYSAFNVAPYSTPSVSAQASTLIVSSSHNLVAKLGIKIPESLVARMVMTAAGGDAWAASESGLVYLPLSTLYDYPILQVESSTVFLHSDDCNRGLAKGTLQVSNAGGGKLTYSVPDTTLAVTSQATSGVAPSTINFTMDPGRTTVTRQYGTNLYSGGVTNSGTAVSVNLNSADAINVPPTIKIFMNYRQADQRGVIYPISTGTTTTEGLWDVLVDETRDKVYILNSGYNRIEVFERATQKLGTAIDVGQLPHAMAMGGDGSTLYVANTGGESISIVDLDKAQETGTVAFPAYPRNGAAVPVTPVTIAYGLFGMEFIMSDGGSWKVVGTEATVRAASSIVPTAISTTTSPRMTGSADGKWIATLGGTGYVYLYDGTADAYVSYTRPYSSTTILGYFGPFSMAPDGSYVLLNGFVLNSSLAIIGGSESPSATTTLPASSKRNIAAVSAIDSTRFVRFTTAVKSTVSSTTTSEARPTLELIDLSDNSNTLVGAMAENPATSLFGTARTNIPSRTMAVDAAGTAYILTLSGLTVVPIATASSGKPTIAASNAIVNATDGSTSFSPGSYVLVSGSKLASAAAADDLTSIPTVLGGSCVTFSDTALPLLQTSPGQIVAQVPATLSAGQYVMRVRSLAYGQQSDAQIVTVSKR
jgi:YVTN family beta-propeller protein